MPISYFPANTPSPTTHTYFLPYPLTPAPTNAAWPLDAQSYTSAMIIHFICVSGFLTVPVTFPCMSKEFIQVTGIGIFAH